MERIKKIAFLGLAAILGVTVAVSVVVNINIEHEKTNASITYSETEEPADIVNDRGEVVETTEVDGEAIPTVEEVDGGMFEDANTGVSTTEGDYEDLGWSEWYDTSSPEAFKNATIGKCITANNKYGAQCVSLARVFWWSYANRDVSTCGTGMAKGMMNCWQQNAGNDFETHWGSSGIQAGDWVIWETGVYGHVGMALGPVNNGYVALLGENQGGKACSGGGAATNIINLSTRGIIGYYRPKVYIKPEPKPEPAPQPTPTPAPVVNKCERWTLKRGDTLGKIMRACKGKVTWGTAMNEYAKHWVDEKTGVVVFDGWRSYSGIGLYAGHTIVYKVEQ